MNPFLYNYTFCGIGDHWNESLWCLNIEETKNFSHFSYGLDYWGSSQGFDPGHTWTNDTINESLLQDDIIRLK